MDAMRELGGGTFATRARNTNTQAVSLSSRMQTQFERAARASRNHGCTDRESGCKQHPAGVDGGDTRSRMQESPCASQPACGMDAGDACEPVMPGEDPEASERADGEDPRDGANPMQSTAAVDGAAARGRVVHGPHVGDERERASEGARRCGDRRAVSREARLAQGGGIEGAPFDASSPFDGSVDSRRLPSDPVSGHRLAQTLEGFEGAHADGVPKWGDVTTSCAPGERRDAWVNGAAPMAGTGGPMSTALPPDTAASAGWMPMGAPYETRLALRSRRTVLASSEREGEPPGFQYCFSTWPGQPTVNVEFDESSRSRKTLITTDDRHVLQTLVDARGALHGDLSIADERRGTGR